MFNFFKKDNTIAENAVEENSNLSNKISLRKEIIIDEVKKQNISCDKARIVFALDHSGSMSSLYSNGKVQDVLERVFPLSLAFDDDKNMEFFIFSDSYKQLKSVTTKNLSSYVKKEMGNSSWGGTSYSPVVNAIYKNYIKENPSDIPTYVLFITDGDNCDKTKTAEIIKECSKYNIFWKFIGIGNSSFNFLEQLDDMSDRTVDNADFIKLDDMSSISDEQLYKLLMQEYGDWINNCRQKNILK